jgi:hypothetical protein
MVLEYKRGSDIMEGAISKVRVYPCEKVKGGTIT